MINLLVLGNVNQFTFANSISAANAKSKEIFSQSLSNIFVVHSNESRQALNQEQEWISHLESNGVSRDSLVDKVVDIAAEEEGSINKFVDYIELIVRGSSNDSHLMVDLTNGTSFQKNLLSIASYILDLKDQYLIDVTKLFKKTEERGFISVDLLLSCYVTAPDSTKLDSLAYLNLSEMVRYKKIIASHTERYVAIGSDSADSNFFRDNLDQSIQLKLKGDQNKDNAVYRIAASSISSSVEDLIRLLASRFILSEDSDGLNRKTFGETLRIVREKVEKNAPLDFDIEFFKKFNDFILYLRNSSTHKGRILTDLEKFKADLSVKMSFPFIEFYTEIVYPIVANNNVVSQPICMKRLSCEEIKSDEILYYGLDGDDTGKVLEELFLASSDESSFRRVSRDITKAISEISKLLSKRLGKGAIVFDAGDDLLFKGNLEEEFLLEIKDLYSKTTSGLTCFIGYGRSFQEVYLALKLAKTQPGKNAIVGIELS